MIFILFFLFLFLFFILFLYLDIKNNRYIQMYNINNIFLCFLFINISYTI